MLEVEATQLPGKVKPVAKPQDLRSGVSCDTQEVFGSFDVKIMFGTSLDCRLF